MPGDILAAPTYMELRMDLFEKAKEELAAYGYSLTDGEHRYFVTPAGKVTEVRLEKHRKGLRAVGGKSDTVLWTGPSAGAFVARFWYAEKIKTGA